MTSKERLNIVLKPYLKASDIMKLFDCGKNLAGDVIRLVKSKYPNRLSIYGSEIRTCDLLETYQLKLEDFIQSAELEGKYLFNEVKL